MDASSKKTTSFQKKDGLRCSASNGAKTESNLLDSTEEAKSKGSSLPPLPLGWPIGKAKISKFRDSDEKENQRSSQLDDSKFTRISSKISGYLFSTLLIPLFAHLQDGIPTFFFREIFYSSSCRFMSLLLLFQQILK